MKDHDDIQKKIEALKEKEGEKKKKKNKEFEEMERLEKENKELKETLLRSHADLQNLRRRMEEEKRSIVDFAVSQTVLEMLPIIDNFERSFEHLPENLKNEEWVKGIGHILHQCVNFLHKHNIKEIEVKVGDKFDPTLHEVMIRGEGNPGEVLEVLQKGYKLNDRVIRTVKVKAAA